MHSFTLVLAFIAVTSASPFSLLTRRNSCQPGADCKSKGFHQCCGTGILSCGSDLKIHFDDCDSGTCGVDQDSTDAICLSSMPTKGPRIPWKKRHGFFSHDLMSKYSDTRRSNFKNYINYIWDWACSDLYTKPHDNAGVTVYLKIWWENHNTWISECRWYK